MARGGGHTVFSPTGGIIVMTVSCLLPYLKVNVIKSLYLTPHRPLSQGWGEGGTLYFPQLEALLLWQFLVCYCISK